MGTSAILDKMPSPRLIKSHLPARVLPTQIWKRKSKVIYTARNPRDALVSGYHFFTGIGKFKCNIEEYAELFMSNKCPYQPYWDHISEFWEMRDQPNLYFTSYEKMSKDIRPIIRDLCIFLEKSIPSEEVLDKAESHLSFKNMKSNVLNFNLSI